MNRRLAFTVLSAAFCLLGAIALHSQQRTDPAYAIVERWRVGGSGGWDYLALDPPGNRLFVTRATHVDVLSTKSGELVGSIADTAGVHGVALAPELKRGYTSNGAAASVTEFDLDGLRVLRVAKVSGTNPDAILFEPVSQHVLTFNGGSSNATVLDATTLKVVATIALPDKPEFAVADGAGRVFVNIESAKGQIVVIDARTLAVTATWALPGCESPSGLALDRKHQRLFSVCDARVMAVTDATSGRHVAEVPIGDHPDAAAFDEGLGLVFSSNGDGTLTVVQQLDADHYRVAATVATQKSARTLALDPRTHRVYLVAAELGPKPQATAAAPRPRSPVLPGTFTVLVVAPKNM
jgi:DNA-binding beta-propeller fold protein YncE